MRLTVSNQTRDALICQFESGAKTQHVLLVPPFSESVQFSLKRACRSLSIRPSDAFHDKDAMMNTDAVSIILSVTSGRSWQRLPVQGDSPWIVYRSRVSRKRDVLTVFPYRDASCFLASIPDSVPLSSLMLPGTHETMAFYGWPISQCQSQPLDTQLRAGIRVVDIRLSIRDGRLIAYHGIFPEFTPFADMLATLHGFLAGVNTATETVVVFIKQEDSDTDLFPTLVREEIIASSGGLDMWYLENRIPSLGEVRGKAVMFSRFGNDGWEGGANGIRPPIWPDSAKSGFEWECSRTLVRTQDWYDISTFFSIPEKASLSMDILVPRVDATMPTLAISFMSASSIPLALPPIVALGFGWPKWGLGFEGVNDRVGRWLLDQLRPGTEAERGVFKEEEREWPRIRGWVLMDYFEDPIAVVPLFVECNFRGRRPGEEGW